MLTSATNLPMFATVVVLFIFHSPAAKCFARAGFQSSAPSSFMRTAGLFVSIDEDRSCDDDNPGGRMLRATAGRRVGG